MWLPGTRLSTNSGASSRPASVSELLQIGPPERGRLARLQSPSPLADAFERRARLILVHATNVGNQPGEVLCRRRPGDRRLGSVQRDEPREGCGAGHRSISDRRGALRGRRGGRPPARRGGNQDNSSIIALAVVLVDLFSQARPEIRIYLKNYSEERTAEAIERAYHSFYQLCITKQTE